MRLQRRWVGVMASLLGLLSLMAVAAGRPANELEAQVLPPSRYYGTVTIDGRIAPGGLPVQALIYGALCGETVTGANGSYALDVAASATRPGCGIDGWPVTFTVSGQATEQSSTFSGGAFVPLDLSIRSTPAPLPPARFYGTVYRDGYAVWQSATVEAVSADSVCAAASADGYGGYVLDVPASSPCAAAGAQIRFRIDGWWWADETATFSLGGYINLDLHYRTQPAVVYPEQPGSVVLYPGESVRFGDDSGRPGYRYSARVTNSGSRPANVTFDGLRVQVTANPGTTVVLTESRSADCGVSTRQPHILICSVTGRAMIAFAVS